MAELDAQGDSDPRLEEERDDVSGRMAEVHARLADMDAESGPASAAALFAGDCYPAAYLWLTFATQIYRRFGIQRIGSITADKLIQWWMEVSPRISMTIISDNLQDATRIGTCPLCQGIFHGIYDIAHTDVPLACASASG